ncbi:MAG: hypothetical protein ACRC8S_14245 [Fimbriiglobus sp.]
MSRFGICAILIGVSLVSSGCNRGLFRRSSADSCAANNNNRNSREPFGFSEPTPGSRIAPPNVPIDSDPFPPPPSIPERRFTIEPHGPLSGPVTSTPPSSLELPPETRRALQTGIPSLGEPLPPSGTRIPPPPPPIPASPTDLPPPRSGSV